MNTRRVIKKNPHSSPHNKFAFSNVGKNMKAFFNRCVRACLQSELRYEGISSPLRKKIKK